MNDRKKAYLILTWGIVMACVAILGSWLKFDYRAAVIVTCSVLIGMAVEMCLKYIDDLEDAEDCEMHVYKCPECGEVVKYRIFADSPDECQKARGPVRRCPICGGMLKEEHGGQDHVQ